MVGRILEGVIKVKKRRIFIGSVDITKVLASYEGKDVRLTLASFKELENLQRMLAAQKDADNGEDG